MYYYIIAFLISLLISLGFLFPARGSPTYQAPSPLVASMSSETTSAVVGKSMVWVVYLSPQPGKQISALQLIANNTDQWQWVEPIKTIDEISSSAVITMTAIPLIPGEMKPALAASYQVGNDHYDQPVDVQQSIQVLPVEQLLLASLTSQEGQVSKGDPVQFILLIQNSSPFTMTQVGLQDIDSDLEWDLEPAEDSISAMTSTTQTIIATVTGDSQLIQPKLLISYQWKDNSQQSRSSEALIQSSPIQVEPGFIDRVSKESIGFFIAAITGAIVALLSGLITELLSSMRKKKADKEQMLGLLRLAVLDAQHAAVIEEEFKTEMLDEVLKVQGLYKSTKKFRVNDEFTELLEAAKKYNRGLKRPGSIVLAQALNEAARKLGVKLEKIK